NERQLEYSASIVDASKRLLALINDILDIATDIDTINLVLTVTLALVLFTDAGAINSSHWREDAALPGRLLGIGLPLMIGLGWGVALLMLTELEVWEAAVLATMLAPTDAALGKAVVSNPRVPSKIRQALNVESGLNDGVALPVFVVFLEAAEAAEGSLSINAFLEEIVPEVGIALAVGVVVGHLGAWAIDAAAQRGLAVFYWLEISVVALALGTYALTDALHGSGFIAAWVAGLMFGRVCRLSSAGEADMVTAGEADMVTAGEADSVTAGEADMVTAGEADSVAADGSVRDVHELAEAGGDALTMLSFLLFGAFLGPTLTSVTGVEVVYALISLVVLRLAATAVSCIGSHLDWPSIVYLGWFGPRGLATIILTIAIVDESDLDGASIIADTALITVALSVVLHGATAWWGSNTYADAEEEREEMHDDMPAVRIPRRMLP
ncbi:MAG: cation:proton antiporter, partial [Actinomycetota bacterium]